MQHIRQQSELIVKNNQCYTQETAIPSRDIYCLSGLRRTELISKPSVLPVVKSPKIKTRAAEINLVLQEKGSD